MGSVINTPLVSVLRGPQVQQRASNVFQNFATGTSLADSLKNSALNREIAQADRDRQKNLQRISNVGQAAAEGLGIISQDPENAERNLRGFIEARRQLLPQVGIDDLSDTEALEAALNEGGIAAAQELLNDTLNATQSVGFKLPEPTSPKFAGVFTAIDPTTGRPTIFQRSDKGIVLNTGLEAPERSPLVTVGGGDKERTQRFGELFDESKNLDKTLSQITEIRDIVQKGGLGSIGASGRVTRGFENVASAVGGFAKNFGLGSDEFDEGSIVSRTLRGTPLGEQANKNAKINSLVTNLAFAVARAQGNQRITDKDFEAAVQTIGTSADNPRQLVDVINQFGENTLGQFRTDVERTGSAFGFNEKQFEQLNNLPSIEPFERGIGAAPGSPSAITIETPLEQISREQLDELSRSSEGRRLIQQILDRESGR